VHRSIGQIKHQRDATLCRIYFCRLTLHVSGVKRPSSGVLKLARQFSSLIWWCDDLPATITHVPVAAVPVLILLMMGAWRPKHVEWVCRNKSCTVLHHVGVLFDPHQLSTLTGFFNCNYSNILHWSHHNIQNVHQSKSPNRHSSNGKTMSQYLKISW